MLQESASTHMTYRKISLHLPLRGLLLLKPSKTTNNNISANRKPKTQPLPSDTDLEVKSSMETFLKLHRPNPDLPVLDKECIKIDPGVDGYMLLLGMFARMFCELLQPNGECKLAANTTPIVTLESYTGNGK